MAVDKTVLDFAIFMGFKIPKDDQSEDELLRHYQKRFNMTLDEAKGFRESVLEDELDEFYRVTFGIVDKAENVDED